MFKYAVRSIIELYGAYLIFVYLINLTVADETMEPSIQVVRITDSSVALDWQRWFSLAEQELPQEYVISFQVLFRPAGDPSMNFTVIYILHLL